MKPGPLNLITDVPGIEVGNSSDPVVKSGTTVVTGSEPLVASVMVLGGAPGTRETDLLAPEQTVPAVDAVVLSGGSAFGQDAATGVMAALAEKGRGFAIGPARVPIVPAAILFDLLNGGDKAWGRFSPYRDLGYRAAMAASDGAFAIGTAGAGTGALVAGPAGLLKGGLGSASAVLPCGATVGAVVAVNALGAATMGGGPHFWAAPFEQGEEFGGLGWPAGGVPAGLPRTKLDAMLEAPQPLASTTIGVIATDLTLTKAMARRLAVATHDGFARALWPAHTPLDGDAIFALSTSRRPAPDDGGFIRLGAVASAVMARAIARGVFAATAAAGDVAPTWRDAWPASVGGRG